MNQNASKNSFFRFEHGDFEISVLSDGFITVPIEIVMPEGSTEQRAEVLSVTGASDPGFVSSKTNIPLLRKEQDLILVDIGAGNKYQPTDGRLMASMASCGIDPADITKIALTHGHPDHIWAMLSDDGNLRFPNATYYVAAAEWDFWMDPEYRTKLPEPFHVFAEGAQRDYRAIQDRVVMVKPGDDIVSGMRVLDTAGHTPGHVSFELSGSDGLIITGDAATNEIASFHYPSAPFGYDALSDLAIESRIKLIDRASTDRIKLLGYHWTYPGIGYAARDGRGYRYVPV